VVLHIEVMSLVVLRTVPMTFVMLRISVTHNHLFWLCESNNRAGYFL
jgi:hypothetical protein